MSTDLEGLADAIVQNQSSLAPLGGAIERVFDSIAAERARTVEAKAQREIVIRSGARIVTATATLGLFTVAVVAAAAAWRQLREFQRGAKIVATTDLLREWSQEKHQRLMRYIHFTADAVWNRKYARRLYCIVTSDEHLPPTRDREKRAKFRARERVVDEAIQDLSLMATRTWNLLEQGVVDEDVLFGQLDYDIVAAYYELENVLALRQVEDNQRYSEFTRLAQRAHMHYLRRPPNEINEAFVDVKFAALPWEEADFERYMAPILAQERAEHERERVEV